MGSLLAKFGAVSDSPCGASGVAPAAVATGASGVAASRATSDGTGSAEGADAAGCSVGNAAVGCWVGNASVGGSVGAAVAAAAGSLAGVGAASADALVSLLDGVELVCAPPELCTIPERGSGEEVKLPWASTELCTIPDVEPDEEPAAEADAFVDDVASVDEGLAADSDDESESDDELEGVESVGSANAIPGVFATAAPTPSATANTPTRTTDCAFTGIPLFLAVRPYERQPVSFLTGLGEPRSLQYSVPRDRVCFWCVGKCAFLYRS